jgi:tRNA A37 threonylcarbamoyladenosine modification protein TsaB
VYGVCSLDAIGVDTTGEVLVVTDARRREVYWALPRRCPRSTVPPCRPAEMPDADEISYADHAALFELPRQAPTYPTASGLVRAVALGGPAGRSEATGGWGEPAPLIPLYLRRPDAKPQPVRS